MRNDTKFFVGKPECKGPLTRLTGRREDIIKTDMSEIPLWIWIGFIWLKIGTVGGLFSAR
jgi:hypothetical protein